MKWQIYTGSKKPILVQGQTLEQAVRKWGKKQPSGKTVCCGLLVRVGKVSKSKFTVWGYWSGEKFLECLG